MIVKRLVFRPDLSLPGYVPEELKNFQGLDGMAEGMGIAHDLLEHTPSKIGSYADEIMAAGASVYVRNEGGYVVNTYQGDRDINKVMMEGTASFFNEISRTYFNYRGDKLYTKHIPKTKSICEDLDRGR
jgi:hypothetical protein